jgi:hypothetical protein
MGEVSQSLRFAAENISDDDDDSSGDGIEEKVNLNNDDGDEEDDFLTPMSGKNKNNEIKPETKSKTINNTNILSTESEKLSRKVKFDDRTPNDEIDIKKLKVDGSNDIKSDAKRPFMKSSLKKMNSVSKEKIIKSYNDANETDGDDDEDFDDDKSNNNDDDSNGDRKYNDENVLETFSKLIQLQEENDDEELDIEPVLPVIDYIPREKSRNLNLPKVILTDDIEGIVIQLHRSTLQCLT